MAVAGDADQPTRPQESVKAPSTRVSATDDSEQPAAAPVSPQEQPTRVYPPEKGNPVPPGSMPAPGQRLGDFYIVEILGKGSFATVYLALQLSLGREVALKVATNQDSEARTLASLEHAHVVPVFSETVDPERGLRLLCEKFVPGTDLQHVMQALADQGPATWSGRAVLDVIDKLCRHEAKFDLAGLHDRERLEGSDFVEAVCWLGARLADALGHAHRRGVLHRDIKPANVLLDRYGRPLLSDFNLALSTERGLGEEHFGGTLRYMAPEHLDAFNPDSGVQKEAVDERSDIYSLGVVLFELLTARPIFGNEVRDRPSIELLHALSAQRRAGTPSPRQVRPELPEVLDRVIRRCLEPDPAHRYQSAQDLAEALDGCRELRHMEYDFPPPVPVTRWCFRFPVWMLIALIFVPHVLGSVVNITYNSLRIVEGLSARQKEMFNLVLLAYNGVVYPLFLWVSWRLFVPVFQARRRVAGSERIEADEAGRNRRRALTFPAFAVALSCLGWLPGGVLFPAAIHLLSESIRASVFWHFVVSFTLSGLIATTYAYFGVQMFVLRILYPHLWVDPRRPRRQAREELGPIEGRLRLFQFSAGLIPLSGAVLLVFSGEEMTLTFRLLIVGLIGLGMLGFGGALLASTRVTGTLAAIVGSGGRAIRGG